MTINQNNTPVIRPLAAFLKRNWHTFLALGIAGLLLYLILRKVDWSLLWQVIANGRYKLLPVILLISSFSYLLRALRWRVLVTAETPVSVPLIFWTTMLGYLGNAYLPARSGDVIRSVTLAKKKQVSASFVLATTLTERIIDVLILIVVGSICILLLPDVPEIFHQASRWLMWIGLLSFLILFGLPFIENWLVGMILSSPIKQTWKDKLVSVLQQFVFGIRTLQNCPRAGAYFLFSISIWLIDGFNTVVGAYMLHQSLTLAQALLLLAGLGLSSVLPSVPGNIGVYQFTVVSVLAQYGFSNSQALAFSLVAQGITYLVISFWGVCSVLALKSAR